ncbi:MAG: META domain-containing protein [Promicromonosporaceae bacterium]|nr:META domain-containing protein [Promicromonosporaceae bacterium]
MLAKSRILKAVVAGAALTVLLAGCAENGAIQMPTGADYLVRPGVNPISFVHAAHLVEMEQPAMQLTGNYQSTEVTGLPAGVTLTDPITIQFADGTLSASAGCNRLFGPYQFEPNAGLANSGTLVAENLAATMMWCEGKMEGEQWLIKFLTSKPTVMVGMGSVVLSGDGASVTLMEQ